MTDIVPVERITDKIYLLRGKKVLMDRDLAQLYGVEFREVSKLFITSFDRPSFEAIRGKEAVTTGEKSMVFKETPKKLSSLS